MSDMKPIVIDRAWRDGDIGDRLQTRDVDELKAALQWLCTEHDFRIGRIAVESGVSSSDGSETYHVENFLKGKTKRPRNDRLGKLILFCLEHRELLADSFDFVNRIVVKNSQISPSRIMKDIIGVSDSDLLRAYQWYPGQYLCFRYHYDQDCITVSLLRLYDMRSQSNYDQNGEDDLPLPTFLLRTQYPDPHDNEIFYNYDIEGFYFCRNGNFYIEGKYDGEPKSFIFTEPLTQKFRYMSGVCLQRSITDGVPFAAKMICERLEDDAEDEFINSRIGLFCFEDCNKKFDRFDVIIKNLGPRDILKWQDNDS